MVRASSDTGVSAVAAGSAPLGTAFMNAIRMVVIPLVMAVVFTGVTLAIGVSTWAFSPLKFQADMGLLLAFMFTTNMLMAVTVLPALAVVIEAMAPLHARQGRPEVQ